MGMYKIFVPLILLLVLTSAGVKKDKAEIYHDGWIDFNKNGKKDIFEDASQTVDARVADLLAQMTMEEKTCQMVTLYGYARVLPGWASRWILPTKAFMDCAIKKQHLCQHP